jgi:prepilin-type N-terminal cleavage/methylation domain-containing protein
MKQCSNSQCGGFTIIELLISITVLCLLVTLSYANYAKTNQRQTLVAAGQNIKNILRDAQSRSFSGEVDCSVCGCGSVNFQPLNGWYVDFDTKEFYGECSNSQFSNHSYTINSDVTLTSYLSSPGPVLFRHDPPGTDKEGLLCLKYKDLDDSFFSIKISASGEVSDNGLVSTCP